MEKAEVYNPQPIRPAVRPYGRRKGVLSVLLAFTCTTIILWEAFTGTWLPVGIPSGLVPDEQNVATPFSWVTLPTKTYLDYIPCYNNTSVGGPYQCARLALPMDYWNGTTNATISLAVIRKAAVVPVTDSRYGGAVLLNPGGPGGSGVDILMRGGKHVRETIDAPDGKLFDRISFGPRGVGSSKPAAECIKNHQLDHSWQVRVMEEGVFEASDAAFGRLWSISVARSQSCSLPLPDGEPDIRKYVTTASVARDMLEIEERHGDWREAEARRLLNEAAITSNRLARCTTQPASIPQSLVYKPNEEKIQYWGFSYGTYLGNTFAAMFPERVERLIIDGVLDAYNYKKTLWSDNLLDTEKDWEGFSYHWARAGYPACALANETGSTTAETVKD